MEPTNDSFLFKGRPYVDRLLAGVVIFLMTAMVVDVTWQVVTRFILRHPSSWTEETANFLLIWIGLVGSAMAMSRKAHLGIDYFVNKLSPKKRELTRIIVFSLALFFSVVILFYGGVRLVAVTLATNQLSPALQVKMGYVYLSLPLSGLFLTYYSLLFLIQSVSDWRRA
jgi:TRAP-type C4-dicarboxylate transport system permease small subunit